MFSVKSDKFTEDERDALYRIMQARRDMRHFIPNLTVDSDILQRILTAAHTAPSVGLMQPWRFIHIRNTTLREKIAELVDTEHQKTAEQMDARKTEFIKLKLEGIRECAELIAVVQAPDDGTILGRRTMPDEMALCSTACAIQNLWLASRAENLGMGWVSLFDPQELAALLNCPVGAKPVALLCIGPVKEFYARPMLEMENWRQGKTLEEMISVDGW